MPRIAMIHIQKIAPGPPEMIAVATPTMLPVPMVAASAVQRLWNWLMALSSRPVCAVTLRSVKIAPMVFFIQWAKWLNWKPFVRTVMQRPAIKSSASPIGPQTMPLTKLFACVIISTILLSPILCLSAAVT